MLSKHLSWVAVVALAVTALGCGDDSGTVDTGLTAAPVCTPSGVEQQVVAVAGDGSRLAYLACAADGASVWTRPLDDEDGEPVQIAAATPTTSIRFLLDHAHVLYGADGQWFVRAADGSSAATPLGAGDIEQTRSFLERVSSTAFEARLLVLERAGDERTISVRAVGDGYQATTTLLTSNQLSGDLSHLSASGRTLVTRSGEGAEASYLKLRTNSAKKTVELPFGPEELAMAPVGLGDTHNFAFSADALVRVELETGARVVLADRDALVDETALIEREDAPGVKYAHFIVDGNPSRRIRDATEPLETLVEANATHQALSTNNKTIVYLSDGELWAISATAGGSPISLISDAGAPSAPALAFSADGSEVALRAADGGLRTAAIDGSQPAVRLDDGDVRADSIGHDGTGARLVWISGAAAGTAGTLRSAAVGAGSAETVASAADAWWPVPGSAELLYLNAGVLKRISP